MIYEITCSTLRFPSTSDDYEMNKGVYKSTSLGPTIKQLIK